MPPIIILKLDDIVAHPGAPIHPHWQRITDYLESRRIPSAMGIIGGSLENPPPAYRQWIIDHHRKGLIEFWCHGYHLRTHDETTGEFESNDPAAQQAILEKCQLLAREHLGLALPAFGPHWSATTDATDQALQNVPEILIWLNGPERPRFFRRLSIPRTIRLEDPVFIPDPEKFRSAYQTLGIHQRVLVLQGHPAAWDSAAWSAFTQIMDFLHLQSCSFTTPSAYLRSLSRGA